MTTKQPTRRRNAPAVKDRPLATMEEIVAAAKADYPTFLGIVWPHVSYGKAPYGELERDAFGWACGQEEGRGNKRYLFCNREFGKSTGITYPLPAWLWLRDPTVTGSVFTKSGKKALEAGMATRGLLRKVAMARHLEPPVNSWHKDLTDHFWVNGAQNEAVPSFKVLGSTGQSTGGRNDFVILDDFETPENSMTREARARTLERIHEIIRTIRDGAFVVAVGTYARDQSVYQNLIDEGWEHRIYPLLYPTPEEITLATSKKTGVCHYAPLILKWLERGYDGQNRPVKAGGIVQPERFSPEYVAEKQAGSLANFRRHYQGIRVSNQSDEYSLRLSDFLVHSCSGPVAPTALAWGLTTGSQQTATTAEDIEVDAFGNDAFRRPAFVGANYAPFPNPTVAVVDPAGYGKDEFAYAVASRLCGNYFVRRLWASRLKPDGLDDTDRKTIGEALNQLVADIVRFGVTTIQIESQFGGPALADLVRRITAEKRIPCIVTLVPARGQKEARIGSALSPLLQSHRIVLDDAVAQDKELQHQITRLTQKPGCLEHDDRLEVLAGAVALISADDAAIPEATHQINHLESERDDLMEELGMTVERPRWGDHRRKS